MTSSVLQHRNIATPEQAAQAFMALSALEKQRLRQIARLRALGLEHMTWEDLLHEALYRTLAGKRLWPLEIGFVAFLAQTMRSVASEERDRVACESIDYEPNSPDDQDHARPRKMEQVADDRSPESDALARGAITMIEKLFANDPDAIHVLHGLAEGLTPAETQSHFGMDATQYASTQRRIQRTLARKFGKSNYD